MSGQQKAEIMIAGEQLRYDDKGAGAGIPSLQTY